MLLQLGPLRLRYLHAVLAENTLTEGNSLVDRCRGNCLGHGNQPHARRIAVSCLRGKRDLFAHETKPCRNVGGGGGRRGHVSYLASRARMRNLTAPGNLVHSPRAQTVTGPRLWRRIATTRRNARSIGRRSGRSTASSTPPRTTHARNTMFSKCSHTPRGASIWGMCGTTRWVTSWPATCAPKATTCCIRWAGTRSACRR